jgi:hypothetical protein
MRNALALLCGIAALFVLGCNASWSDKYWNPTSPYYDGTGNHGGPYDGSYKDSGPDWSCDLTGEWEGYLYESYRSDNLPLRRRPVAMRCSYSDTTWTGSSRYEWVDVDVLVDGRPTALETVEVDQGGYLSFDSYKDDIDFEMSGYASYGSFSGQMHIKWDEKVKLPGTDKSEKHYVSLGGNCELYRVRGSQWAAAWQLFDTYGDGVFDLSDEIWQSATLEGLQHLAAEESSTLRMPRT